jgi:hypothetical protein
VKPEDIDAFVRLAHEQYLEAIGPILLDECRRLAAAGLSREGINAELATNIVPKFNADLERKLKDLRGELVAARYGLELDSRG